MIGRVVEAVTERIREASDIVDVVGSVVTLKRAGRDFKAICPFHSEKTPSFHVVPSKQIFHCFGCGVGGDVFKFIQIRESVGFLEAREILAARAGIALEEQGPKRGPDSSKVDLERANRWAAAWFRKQLEGPAGSIVRKYIADRGISDSSSRGHGLGFAPDQWDGMLNAARKKGVSEDLLAAAGLIKRSDDGRVYDAFRNRLVFPIVDAMGRTLGFGGRTLSENDPAKYLNSPQNALFDKSRCLYGLSTARPGFAESGTANIVEGYTDCLLAQQHGFQNTVATLGTALTTQHVQILRRYVERVVLVFDSDEAGQRAADRALEVFIGGRLDVRIATVPEGKDPADYLRLEGGREGFERVLTSAFGALEYKWQQVLRQCSGRATERRHRVAIEEFLGLVAKTMSLGDIDPIQWGLISNQVGKLLSLPPEDVSRQLRLISVRSRSIDHRDVGPAPAKPAGIRNAAAAASLDLLEVLLNEPGYYDSIASKFDPDRLPDAATRAIGHAAVDLAKSSHGLSIAALIARFESVETARRITELQVRGERRGEYGERTERAVARLQQLGLHRQVDSLRRSETPADQMAKNQSECGPHDCNADERTRQRAANEVLRRINHFAARRHLAKPKSAGVPTVEPSPAS